MNQIGEDICNVPEVDGYCCLVVCIDYFSIWSEAKPRKDKKTTTVSQLLYELIRRHGCFSIQINVVVIFSSVSAKLHRLTGTIQLVTSAYHQQINGFVERQNKTIENLLIKVLDRNLADWSYVMEGALFAHRVTTHACTRYSPFGHLYNRKAVLLTDIKYNSKDLSNLDEPFDKEMFVRVLESASCCLRNQIHHKVEDNIKRHKKNNNTIMAFSIWKVMTLKLEIKFFWRTISVMIKKTGLHIWAGERRISWELPQLLSKNSPKV